MLALHGMTKDAWKRFGDEGYKLLVTEQNVKIQAATEAGLFYGVQSLRQLLPPEIYKRKTDEEVFKKNI